jgi:hypothetical protein
LGKSQTRHKPDWHYAPKYDRIIFLIEEDATMSEKKPVNLKEFIANVNKKEKKHSGNKIQYRFVNRKRK